MKCDKTIMRLYAVTDRSWLGNQTLYQQVSAALEGGVTCVQLREKDLDTKTFFSEAIELAALCRQYHVPFIVNDDVSVAIKCRADGVHVGQSDMNVKKVRKMIGADMILGVSAVTVAQALTAQQNGADYLGVGAVFPTNTKTDADTVSLETLKAICDAVSIPVVAIGGIQKDNITKLAGTNVDGVALVSAIFASSDIKMECLELLNLSRKMTGGLSL